MKVPIITHMHTLSVRFMHSSHTHAYLHTHQTWPLDKGTSTHATDGEATAGNGEATAGMEDRDGSVSSGTKGVSSGTKCVSSGTKCVSTGTKGVLRRNTTQCDTINEGTVIDEPV